MRLSSFFVILWACLASFACNPDSVRTPQEKEEVARLDNTNRDPVQVRGDVLVKCESDATGVTTYVRGDEFVALTFQCTNFSRTTDVNLERMDIFITTDDDPLTPEMEDTVDLRSITMCRLETNEGVVLDSGTPSDAMLTLGRVPLPRQGTQHLRVVCDFDRISPENESPDLFAFAIDTDNMTMFDSRNNVLRNHQMEIGRNDRGINVDHAYVVRKVERGEITLWGETDPELRVVYPDQRNVEALRVCGRSTYESFETGNFRVRVVNTNRTSFEMPVMWINVLHPENVSLPNDGGRVPDRNGEVLVNILNGTEHQFPENEVQCIRIMVDISIAAHDGSFYVEVDFSDIRGRLKGLTSITSWYDSKILLRSSWFRVIRD